MALLLFFTACGNRKPAEPTAEQKAAQPAEAQPVETPAAAQPAAPRVQTVLIPSRTIVEVRLAQTLDTKSNRPGDRFYATLMNPIVVNGKTVVPKGTRFSGHLTEAKPSGRFKGRAVMGLTLDSFELHGRGYGIHTSQVGRATGGHKKRNAVLIGGGSGLGAAIGAVAGKTGALIGAGAGAAAGATGAAITGKKNVLVPAETPFAFALQSPVLVRAS